MENTKKEFDSKVYDIYFTKAVFDDERKKLRVGEKVRNDKNARDVTVVSLKDKEQIDVTNISSIIMYQDGGISLDKNRVPSFISVKETRAACSSIGIGLSDLCMYKAKHYNDKFDLDVDFTSKNLGKINLGKILDFDGKLSKTIENVATKVKFDDDRNIKDLGVKVRVVAPDSTQPKNKRNNGRTKIPR